MKAQSKDNEKSDSFKHKSAPAELPSNRPVQRLIAVISPHFKFNFPV